MCARTTMRWHCRFYAPGGELLDEYDSPYGHGMHPFMVKMYPLIDGEVHSFVEDVVDQQRYINRLITLMDHCLLYTSTLNGTCTYLVIYSGSIIMPHSSSPHWSNISPCTTYRVPNFERNS